MLLDVANPCISCLLPFNFFFVLLAVNVCSSQEVFPTEYGLSYDADMQLLVWEFLSKLERLLPVPDLGQVGLRESVILAI